MRIQKKISLITVVICSIALLIIISCNVYVVLNAKGRAVDDISNVSSKKLGVLLGTSPITPSGLHNYSFDNRIKAASKLYSEGKVNKLIVSGGDYTITEEYGCDEPKAMRDSLIANGVRSEDIFMDYEGTTTLRSLNKIKNYYNYSDTVILISQGYHNYRALTMADKLGLPAIAINAQVPPSGLSKMKNYARESLARVKMLFSLYFLPPHSSQSFSSDDITAFNTFLNQ